MLRRNNYLEINTGVERKALSNTDYGSNDDRIFENGDLKLDGQIPPIDKLDIQFDSNVSSERDYRDGIDKFFQDDGFLNSRFSHQSNNNLRLFNFDMLRLSLTLFLSDRNHFFLTSIVN